MEDKRMLDWIVNPWGFLGWVALALMIFWIRRGG